MTVGIGASAGGIKALKEFFAKMPADSGMAFVVVLHLSQTHESNLASILQRETLMPVIKVTEPTRIEPNHVYVIPPAQGLEMVDSIVRLTKPQRVRGQRVAIDRFFRTLADSYGESAVAIVLSGAGEDGTLGIKKIKEENGFTIAQKPEEAEYEQMPKSAIKTGLVDCVLPVEKMPEKLLSLRDSTEDLNLTTDSDDALAPELKDANAFRDILTILRVRTGHDFSNYKQPTLLRRIARHLQIHELEDLSSYARLLRENTEEADFLLKNLLINVTNFFRDPHAFDVLESDVIPRMFAGKTAEDQLRVWVAGCATGEEAYSVGILLHEYASRFEDSPKIQIFASDVDDEAIAQAREGLYAEAIIDHVTPQRLKRYFVKEGRHFRVKKELREMILFAPHNVLRDPPFSKLDLITCRNLMIYLNRETQERLMQVFHFALHSDGFLFLGASETADNVPVLFSPLNKKYRVYLRRPTNPMAHTGLSLPFHDKWQAKPAPPAARGGEQSYSFNELHFRVLEKYAPPSILINKEYDIVHLSENAGRFLQFAGGEPSNNLLKVVHPDLRADLRTALFTARQDGQTAEYRSLTVRIDGENRFVNLRVYPSDVPDAEGVYLLVIFEETEASETIADIEAITTRGKDGKGAMDALTRHLEDELQRTKERLRMTVEQYDTSIEELRAANEELQAINEELRSATEELETSKEELKSVNEELTTVNTELKEKVEEVSHINADWQNLMHSTNIGVIFLDRNLRIKRFTSPVQEIFNVINSDAGRPLEHLTQRLDYKNFSEDAKQVLRSLLPIEREVKSENGQFFIARMLPYRTLDDKIDGVVLTFTDITERRRAEEAKFFLASIVESSDDSVVTVDFNGKITSWNRAAESLYGYPAYEAIGKSLTKLTLPDNIREVLRNIDKIKDSQTVEVFDSIRLNKDGRQMNLEIVMSPVKDADGQVMGVSTIARDVTKRRTAEDALRESEERYRTLFTSMDEGYAVVEVLQDENGAWNDFLFLEVNPAFVKQTGMEYPVGRTAAELLGTPNPHWAQIYGQVAETGEPLRFEEGEPVLGRVFDLYCFRLDGEGSRRVAVLFTDITARKQSEQALSLAQESLQIAVDAAEMGTWDLDLTKDFSSRRSLRHNQIFGYDDAQPEWGREIARKHVVEEDLEIFDAAFARALETGELKFEVRVRWSDGSIHWMACSGRFNFDSNGKPVRGAGFSFDITERKRAEEALRESEERYRAIVNQVIVGIGEVDLTGKFTLVNDRFAEITGYSREELLSGMRMQDITHPEDLKANIELFQKCLTEGVPFVIEKRYIRKDGSEVWVNNSVSPECDAEGKPKYITAVSLDITERKEAEKALKESEQLLRHVTENIPGGSINVFDRDLQYLFAEGKGLAQVGLTAEGLIGKTLYEVFPAEQVEYVKPFYERAFAGESLEFELEVAGQWYVIYTAPLRDLQGNINSVIALAQNITERRRVQEALQQSEERLRLLVESVEDYAILTLTPDSKIDSWNPGAERIFGYTEEEILGQPGAIIFTPEDLAKKEHEKEIETAVETGRAMDERWHVRKDGSLFFASGVLTVLGDDARNGFVKILRDLTERKQFEDALKEADRRKDEFLATLAHELRNPLAPIRTALEIMRRGVDKEKGQHAREIIERQTNQLVHLVDDLLDISRITQGKIKLRKERVDIADSITTAIETVQPYVESLRHRLDVRMPDAPVFVEADRTRLTQIIFNLLHNSAKYTEPGGHILLIAAREGDEAVIRVRDNGIGIQFEMLPAIFDIFAQTTSGEKRGQGGLGIGLSLVKKLVEMHGGRVEAHSEGEGKGSEFVIRLPLAAEQTPERKKEIQKTEMPGTPIKAGRIVIVDDNTDAANMLEVFLSMENHEVRTAFTGNEALQVVEEFQPDTIILDIGLPDIDGYEVAKRLRGRFPGICLIALSGWGQEEDRRRSSEAGFNHHLVKPVNIEELKTFLCL